MWVRLQAQNGQKQRLSSETRQSILDLRKDGYSMQEIAKKLKISTLYTTPFTEQSKPALTRIERGVGSPSAQLSKRTSTLECLV